MASSSSWLLVLLLTATSSCARDLERCAWEGDGVVTCHVRTLEDLQAATPVDEPISLLRVTCSHVLERASASAGEGHVLEESAKVPRLRRSHELERASPVEGHVLEESSAKVPRVRRTHVLEWASSSSEVPRVRRSYVLDRVSSSSSLEVPRVRRRYVLEKASSTPSSHVLEKTSSTPSTGKAFLGHVIRVRRLHVSACGLSWLPAHVFSWTRDLLDVRVRSHNDAWSVITMEMHRDAFEGVVELRTLDLADNNIRTLPPLVFCSLDKLQLLNLSRNRLHDVVDIGFNERPLSKSSTCCNRLLEVIDLSHNNIAVIPDGVFSCLRSLRQLYLQDNRLSSLSDDSLKGVGSLLVIDVSSNQLTSVPPSLFDGCRDVREIRVNNNNMSVLSPGFFEGQRQLQLVDLSYNRLTVSSVNRDTFTNVVGVVVLQLRGNRLSRIDAHVFDEVSSWLQVLDLRDNVVDKIADGAFSSLLHLHTLLLSGNRLTLLDNRLFGRLHALTRLQVDDNLIEQVDAGAFDDVVKLQHLGLSGNRLSNVPTLSLRSLRVLQSLDLSNNLLSKLDDDSFPTTTVRVLVLADNRIVNVSKRAFAGLSLLQLLDLSRNRVSTLHAGTFDDNLCLKALRVDDNRLTEIVDGVFTHLQSLLWLNVSNNMISMIDYTCLPRSLQWLDVHDNRVVRLTGGGGGGGGHASSLTLKTLDVSDNLLTLVDAESIPDSIEQVFFNDNAITLVDEKTFVDKINLSRVVLQDNRIRDVSLATFLWDSPSRRRRRRRHVYLAGNPLHCDCHMEWLLSSTGVDVVVDDLDHVTCTLKEEEVFLPVRDVNPGQFVCRYESHCYQLCKCCDFDACDCEMTCPQGCTCYHDVTWSVNVVRCSHGLHTRIPDGIPMDATAIFVDGNDLGTLVRHVFLGKKRLLTLYANGSVVSVVEERTFHGVWRLRELHLQDNRLTRLQGREFDQLGQLQLLDLRRNRITYVHSDTFSTTTSLKLLRLDGNKIVDFWPSMTMTTAMTMTGDLWWTCSCDGLRRLRAYMVDHVTTANTTDMWCDDDDRGRRSVAEVMITCFHDDDDDGVHKHLLYDDSSGQFLGQSMMMMIMIVIIIVIVVVFTILTLWRRKMCFTFFSEKHKDDDGNMMGMAHDDDDDDDDHHRLYDFYVMYSARDEDVVGMVIASHLESLGYSVCLHHRDVLAGNMPSLPCHYHDTSTALPSHSHSYRDDSPNTPTALPSYSHCYRDDTPIALPTYSHSYRDYTPTALPSHSHSHRDDTPTTHIALPSHSHSYREDTPTNHTGFPSYSHRRDETPTTHTPLPSYSHRRDDAPRTPFPSQTAFPSHPHPYRDETPTTQTAFPSHSHHYRDDTRHSQGTPIKHGNDEHVMEAVLQAAEASRRLLIVLTGNLAQWEWRRDAYRKAIVSAARSRRRRLRRRGSGTAVAVVLHSGRSTPPQHLTTALMEEGVAVCAWEDVVRALGRGVSS